MKILRNTKTLCPDCGLEIDGQVVQNGEQVFLSRKCPRHGSYQFLLSNNGALYADLDRFYFDILKGNKPRGRITNYWVLSTSKCQMKCKYCQVEVESPAYDEMNLKDFKFIVKNYGKVKLTLSGGEPTLHEELREFFKEAAANGQTLQLATNGVELAQKEFCRLLADLKAGEVRISFESLDNKETTAIIGTEQYFEDKLKAINNLEDFNINTILSPTIFRGVNEDQVSKTLAFAAEKPFVKEISANGFSWVGQGIGMEKNRMIMPDEMMDVLFQKHFNPGCREEIFTFQKLILAMLQLMGVRLCLYTQIMIFVREKNALVPFTDYLDMKKMKKGIKWWEKHAKKAYPVRLSLLLAISLLSLRPGFIRILFPLVTLLIANLFKINIKNYPRKLLPIVFNTNCSSLNADEAVGLQCMSGILYKKNGKIIEGVSSTALLEREKEKCDLKSG